YGDGSTRRDYTYIDDIVRGVIAAMHYDRSRYDVINLGNSRTVSLMEMISVLEEALGKRAELSFEPEQPGDVPVTYADVSKAKKLLGYAPKVPFDTGIRNFVVWLRKS